MGQTVDVWIKWSWWKRWWSVGPSLTWRLGVKRDSGLNQQSSTKTAFWGEGPGIAGEWWPGGAKWRRRWWSGGWEWVMVGVMEVVGPPVTLVVERWRPFEIVEDAASVWLMWYWQVSTHLGLVPLISPLRMLCE